MTRRAKNKGKNGNFVKGGVDFLKIDEQIQKLSVQRDLLIDQSLTGDNVAEIIKANNYLEKMKAPEIDPKSYMWLPDNWFHTGQGYKESLKGVSFDVLQRMGNTFISKAIVNTRVEQIQRFLKFTTDESREGFTIKRKRGHFAKPESVAEYSYRDQKQIEYIIDFLEYGGENSKWEQTDDLSDFVRKIVRDSLILDQMTFECVRDRLGNLKKYYAVDASLIRILDAQDPRYAEEWKKWRVNGFLPQYAQVWNSQILKNPITKEPIIYYPWELAYGVRNKTTNIRINGYGVSEQEVLIDIMTWTLWGMQYNGNFFKQGSQPKGFINIKNPGTNNTTLNEFRSNWRQMMTSVRNCLSGDTFIITPNGKVKLRDLFISDDNDKPITIWTGKKFTKALAVKSGNKVLNRVKLNNGMSIDSSPDHKFKTVSESGDIVWKKRSELKVGEFLMINKKTVDTDNHEPLYYKGIEIESDFFEVVGWLTGDGYIGENAPSKKRGQLSYHHDYEDFIQKHHSLILSKYNINNVPSVSLKSEKVIANLKESNGFKSVSEKTRTTSIVDSDYFEFLYSLGFKSSKDCKIIPDFLFACLPKYRRAFIKGFFSADCHVAMERYIQMSITDDQLRQQTKELLLCEGIRCGSHEGIKKVTNVSDKLSGGRLLVKDNDIFFKKIGLSQIYKGFRENDFKYYSVKESFPSELCKKELLDMKNDLKLCYKETKKRLCNTKITNDISAVLTDKEVLSHNKFIHIHEVLKKHLYNYKIDDEITDFHFEKIVGLEEFNEEVPMYDIEVYDEEHQFIANGILTHNSHKIPVFEGIDLEWVDLQHSNRDMEFHGWVEFLLIITCSVYTIDPSELGFNFKQSSQMFGQQGQKERLQHSKKKGLAPLLKFIEKIINKYIVSELDDRFEFVFTGVDIEDREAAAKVAKLELEAGIVSFEYAFERRMGRPYDPETDTILNPQMVAMEQIKTFGGANMNGVADEEGFSPEGGEEGGEEDNVFNQFAKSEPDDPIIRASKEYIQKTLT